MGVMVHAERQHAEEAEPAKLVGVVGQHDQRLSPVDFYFHGLASVSSTMNNVTQHRPVEGSA